MRLIDADNYRMKLDKMYAIFEESWPLQNGIVISQYSLDAMPTIDAIPVVRCKDCQRCRREDMTINTLFYCGNTGLATEPNGYCYLGERREK